MQREAYYILLHLKLKIKFYTHWNLNWLKKYMPNCLPYLTANLYISFLFPSNYLVTIFKFKKWITISACFRNGKASYSTLALNFKDWPFGIIVTWHFRPKSGHLNDRVHCKPINLFSERSSRFLWPTVPELWKLLVSG